MAVRLDRRSSGSSASDDRDAFVAIVEQDPTLRTSIANALPHCDTTEFASLDDLLTAGLQRLSIVIVVIGPSLSDRQSIEQLGDLTRIRSGVGAILVARTIDPEVMRSALQAGLADAIAYHDIDAELEVVVDTLASRLLKEVTGANSRPTFNAIGKQERGRVTVVFSPKGGVGKSAISVNLAAALVKRTEGPVVLVDLDLQFGDLAVMLRLQPAHSAGEVGSSDDFDADFVRGLLVQHDPTGVWLLAAPTEPSAAEAITARAISHLIATLRQLAAQVIIDTPPVLNEVILQLLDDADEVAFLIGMDVPSVKNARIALHALRIVGIPDNRVTLVLNRADSKVNLAPRDVERALGRKIDIKVPSDVIVTQAINKGIPAVLEYPRSAFARSLDGMALMMSDRAKKDAPT